MKLLVNEIKRAKRARDKYAVVVAVDISGAFDAVSGRHILANIENSGVEGIYVEAARQLQTGRVVEYESLIGLLSRVSKTGCPQGGTASQCLWLIAFNDLLIRLTENGIFGLAYADDLIKKKLDKELAIIEDWCERAELKVSAEKTQILNVGVANYSDRPIVIGGKTVQSKDKLTYLGLTISKEMKWREHLAMLKTKAARYKRVFQTTLFMNGDLDFAARRRLYRQVYIPAITYGCRIWAKDLKFAYQLKALRRLQRSVLLCLAGAYHTTSLDKLRRLFNVADIVDVENCRM